MGINVPARPPATPSPALASPSILNGVAVSARDWTWAARAIAYARGRGCTLLPATASPGYTVPASTTRTFHWRAYQRFPCIQRLWLVRAHRASVTGGESTVVTIKAPAGGTAQTYGVSGSTHIGGSAMYLLEDGVTQTEGMVDLSLDIVNGSASSSLVIDQIQCVELPRSQIVGGASEYAASTMHASNAGSPRDVVVARVTSPRAK